MKGKNGEKEKIRFIINPISGGRKKTGLEALIYREFNASEYEVDIKYTEKKGHAISISRESVKEKFDVVVAVGGDGTVNEVARELISSGLAFGIVPMGSGNGLSRFLKIPMNKRKAFEVIRKKNTFLMDTIRINENYFINVAGIGFDALIGHKFADYGKRGFISYVKLILNEFFTYQNDTYTIQIDKETNQYQAFLISFANSSQFGNEAHIAPLAQINDGLIDICILKKFPWWKSISIAILLYSKGLAKSKYYRVIKTPNLKIHNNKRLKAHIDGNPVIFNSDIFLKIIPLSLKIIVP